MLNSLIESIDYTVKQDLIFTWNNLKVSINNKNILNTISGKIDNGFTAIMGESGSGKTTLFIYILGCRMLSCIALRFQ
jgi:ABC-type multidrug transport system ATPase subunit